MRNLLPALLLSLVACLDHSDIDGSGQIIELRRDVAAFRAVEVADGLRAEIAVGPQEVTLRLDDNIIDRVRVEVRGDVLVLEAKEQGVGFDPSANAVIRVGSPTITAVTVRDGSRARAEVRGGELVAKSHDGARLVIDARELQEVSASASDGSRIDVTGAAMSLEFDASDGSTITSNAPADSVTARSRDGSEVRARASKSVRVQASDGSYVRISGNPERRDVETSDGSSVVFSE